MIGCRTEEKVPDAGRAYRRFNLFASNLFLLLTAVSWAWAQPSIELRQAFLDLASDDVLMALSAHPDDEDGAALAYYRMKHGVKTCSILFTRGEGGQNETGPELYEDLGVLRSDETRAAAKVLGTELWFLNFPDFGYSKTASETFRRWGGQAEVLRRLVYAIRKFKPDVIITNHATTDGHGHHQAVATAAIAAFDAAADSMSFPEQLAASDLHPWQSKKLFFRDFERSVGKPDVAHSIYEVEPLRQRTYAEIAVEALRMHRTQGMDRIDVQRFARRENLYRLVRTSSLYDHDSTSFFAGVDLWRDPTMAPAGQLREALSSLRQIDSQDSLLHAISRLQVQIDSLRVHGLGSPLVHRVLGGWQSKLQAVLRLGVGVQVSVTLDDSVLVPRQRVGCNLRVVSPNAALGSVKSQFELPPGWVMNEALDSAPDLGRGYFEKQYTLVVGDSPKLTLPRRIAQYAPIGTEQRIVAHVSVSLGGYPVDITVAPPFDVAPFMTLSAEPRVMWMPRTDVHKGKTFVCTVVNYLPHKTAGRIACLAPPGWRTEGAAFVVVREDGAATANVEVIPPPDVRPGEYPLLVRSDYWSEKVTARVSDVSLSSPLLVGVVKSYDNTLEAAVRELGAEFKEIGLEDLRAGDLSRYTTIVVDIRAYLVRDDLQKFNGRLLEYVRRGGNLVVMYQREIEWKPEYAPFPFRIGRRRVCDEDAPVRVLIPDHPLFTLPNRISDADWEGWKQERGLHFPTDVASEYEQLVSTNDPDETPLTTGFLVAKSGEGTYIYSSLVWYRELREKHAGAMRCFANMVSYPAYRK